MTALSNLISKLDCEKTELASLFKPEYNKYLLKSITDKTLDSVKQTVDKYIREELNIDVINYKIYSYKTLKGITVEILIQPENTSVIIQYLLEIDQDKAILRRVK